MCPKNVIRSSVLFSLIGLLAVTQLFVTAQVEKESLLMEPSTTTVPKTKIRPIWNRTFGGVFVDSGKSIVRFSSGGYVITGWTNSTGSGDYDIFTLMTDPLGNELWNSTFGSSGEDKAYQIIQSSFGGFLIVGTFYNASGVPHANSNLFVARIAHNSSIIWCKQLSGPDQDESSAVSDIGRSIVELPNGDIIVSGTTNTDSGGCDLWLCKLSFTGNLSWTAVYHNRDIDRSYTPHSMTLCKDGGIAVVGYTYNSSTTNDLWLVKVDASGNHQWNRTYGDDLGYQRPEGLVECQDGGFGIIANTHSFGAGDADAWIVRTDSFGNQLWNQTYGGSEEDSGSYIMELADGGFAFTGGTHSFDVGNGDIWLVRTFSNGSIAWNHTIGDSYGNSGSAFVFEGNNTFTLVGGTYSLGQAFADIWLVKVQIELVLPPATTLLTTNAVLPLSTVVFLVSLVTIVIQYKQKHDKSR